MPRLALAFALFFLACLAAQAERRVALVVGIDNYSHLSALRNAAGDARFVAEALRGAGFEVDLRIDSDIFELEDALDEFMDRKAADVALFYFAGHGVSINGNGFILPSDTSAASLSRLMRRALPLEEVIKATSRTGRVALVFSDACRNDPFALPADAAGRSAIPLAVKKAARQPVQLSRDDLDELRGLQRPDDILQSDGSAVAFAASASDGQAATDGRSGHTAFARALVAALLTEDTTLLAALEAIQRGVKQETDGRQTAFFAISSLADIPLRIAGAAQGDRGVNHDGR